MTDAGFLVTFFIIIFLVIIFAVIAVIAAVTGSVAGIVDDEDEEYEDEEEVPEFKYEEKLPVGIDSHLNLYQYETFCFTNMKVTLKEKEIFKTEDRMLVFY